MIKALLIGMTAILAVIAYMVICRIEDNHRKYGTKSKLNYIYWEYRYQTNNFGKAR